MARYFALILVNKKRKFISVIANFKSDVIKKLRSKNIIVKKVYNEKQLSKLNYKNCKLRFPFLKSYEDIDGDGVVNKKDCKPFNKKKQDIYQNYPLKGQEIYVGNKIYKAFDIIRYGRELGLPATDTHRELREKGYNGDELRRALSLYRDFEKGAIITPTSQEY